MRMWITAAALIGVIALVTFGPRISAERTELHRHHQLDAMQVGQELPPAKVSRWMSARSALPACPIGDSLDTFLDRVAPRKTASLWIPACREQPFAADRGMLVLTSRAGFA